MLQKKKKSIRQIIGILMLFSFLALANFIGFFINICIAGEFDAMFTLFAFYYLWFAWIPSGIAVLLAYHLLTKVYTDKIILIKK